MVANILPTDTPLTQGMGSKGQTIYFSERSHVAYQIEADDSGSNLVANSLPTDTPSTQGVGSKGQTISSIESTVITHVNDPWVGSKGLFFFLKVVMSHMKLKWKKCRPTCKVTL